MSGFKDFSDGQFFTGDEVDGYLMRQAAMRFTTTASLLATLTAGIREVGMIAWADDTQAYYLWDGASWKPWQSPWKTPAMALTAGGNAVTFGNSVTVQRWRYSGGDVEVFWKLTVGSTANMQAGNYAWGLPVSSHSDLGSYSPIGQLIAFDTSGAAFFMRQVACIGSQTACGAMTEGGVRLATSTPFGVATGDVYAMLLRYQPTAAVELT